MIGRNLQVAYYFNVIIKPYFISFVQFCCAYVDGKIYFKKYFFSFNSKLKDQKLRFNTILISQIGCTSPEENGCNKYPANPE